MKTPVWAAIAAFVIIASSLDSALGQDVGELREQFESVKKIVDDPLTDEGGIRRALRELQSLAKATAEFEEEDLSPDSQEATLAGEIVNSLRAVESRLPKQENRRRARRPGFPAPGFAERDLLANLSAELHQAQQSLARHVSRPNAGGDARVTTGKVLYLNCLPGCAHQKEQDS